MKMRILTVLLCMLTLCSVGMSSALADGNALEIYNQTPDAWQVSADILVPPKLGVEGGSPGTCGYADFKTVTVQGGSSESPARATITLDNGGQLQSVSVSSTQGLRCSIDDIRSLGYAYTLEITTDGIVLENGFGSEAGRCDF